MRDGLLGYAARGTVMIIMGGFFVHAGKTARASDVGNVAGALRLVGSMSPVALGVVALGLVAYGVYALLQSIYPLHHHDLTLARPGKRVKPVRAAA